MDSLAHHCIPDRRLEVCLHSWEQDSVEIGKFSLSEVDQKQFMHSRVDPHMLIYAAGPAIFKLHSNVLCAHNHAVLRDGMCPPYIRFQSSPDQHCCMKLQRVALFWHWTRSFIKMRKTHIISNGSLPLLMLHCRADVWNLSLCLLLYV